MHIQTISFDRVYSVFPKASRMGFWTEFGFEAGGKKVYSARVIGHPSVLEGVPLALALRKAGAWREILGWANLNTGEVVVHDRRASDIVVCLVLLVAFDLFMVVPAATNWAFVNLAAKVGVVGAALFFNSFLVWGALKSAHQISASKELKRFLDSRRNLAWPVLPQQ